MNVLVDIEAIPYKNFKEKLKITKGLGGGITVEDLGSLLMVVRLREENCND
ncbi:flavoprotein [Hathewaya histolytica]|uniref:flavoprotein n=1 Tax=Hathewaya histolytica TaxID=1498 RepID=UPI003B67A059